MSNINDAKSEEARTKSYKLCPSCGNFCHDSEKQIYCIICGEKMMQECPACKEPIIYPTAKHCHKCGKEYQLKIQN